MKKEVWDLNEDDTIPCQFSARERALILLEADPELFQAVLDLEEEMYFEINKTKLASAVSAESEFINNNKFLERSKT